MFPLMHSEMAWVLVSLGTEVQPQIILKPGYLPGYLAVSCDYGYYVGYAFLCRLKIVFNTKKSTGILGSG